MKKLIFITLTLYVTGATLTGCDSSHDKNENHDERTEEKKEIVIEANQDVDNTKADFTAEYNTFKKESDARYEENERKIEEFNKKIENEKKEAKAEYKKKVAELEQKNRDMKNKADSYKDEDSGKWESFKREFNHDMDELGTAIRDLGRDNKK